MRLLELLPKTAVAALALAALLAGTSTGRQAGVALALSSAVQTTTPMGFSGGLTAFKNQEPVLYLQFHNLTQVPADAVRFLVDFGPGKEKKTITETGDFHPGITIARTYRLGSHQQSGPVAPAGPQFAVAYVHFTDGTSWQTN
jgi:hypothetical protein